MKYASFCYGKICLFWCSAVLLLAMFLTEPLLAEQVSINTPTKAEVVQKTMKIQMPFVANHGQVDERARFYANTFGGTVFVTKQREIVYSLPNKEVTDARSQRLENRGKKAEAEIQNIKSGVAIKETLVGGRVQEITGNEKAVTNVNYFKGADPSKWKTNVSTYEMVSLGEVYDGIELKLKAYGNNVEKLFCVKPGADPDQIKIRLSGLQPPESPFVKGDLFMSPAGGGRGWTSPLEKGARGLSVNEHGELEVETELGIVKFTKPIAYQEINGKRVCVDVEYNIQNPESRSQKLESGKQKYVNLNPKSEIQNRKSKIVNPKWEYGFKVASYDRTKDLIIDPLLASTYLGGSSNDTVTSIAISSDGNVYVTGYTKSSDFPTTTGVYDASYNGSYTNEEYDTDVFVAKLNGDLTSLLASTYLGGSGYDYGNSITVDTGGNVYVTGQTLSTNFPTTSGAYGTSSLGGYSDAFVAKLNGDLTSLLSSTYLGGTIGGSRSQPGKDGGYSIVVYSNGSIYVAGGTNSSDFPTTTGAYDTSFNSSTDAFISKLSGDLTSLLASTYLGGDYNDIAKSMAIDSSGNVYATGGTYATGFPTTAGAYDTSRKGDGEIFVSKFSGDLTSLLASTFLGGSHPDEEYDFDSIATSIAINSSGNVYITGETHSSDFPTTSGAYDTSFNSNTVVYPSDVIVAKLNGSLTTLLASTYLGGSSSDWANSIVVDSDGNVYVTGKADSSNFPTTPDAYDISYNVYSDAFVSKLNGDLTSLLASTYLGEYSICNSLAKDSSGNVYVAGATSSGTFPTTSGAYDTSYNENDAFVSKFDSNLSSSSATSAPSPSPTLPPLPTPTISQTPTPASKSSVFGIVVDGDSNALEGVTVTMVKSDFSKSTSTNEDGYYRFEELDEGNYTLTCEKDGYQSHTQDISLGSGEVKEVGTITMELTGGNISGYVTDFRGNPIASVVLSLKGVKSKVAKTVSSDEFGAFEFADLDADTYVIIAKKKGYKKTRQKVALEEDESEELEIVMKRINKRLK